MAPTTGPRTLLSGTSKSFIANTTDLDANIAISTNRTIWRRYVLVAQERAGGGCLSGTEYNISMSRRTATTTILWLPPTCVDEGETVSVSTARNMYYLVVAYRHT